MPHLAVRGGATMLLLHRSSAKSEGDGRTELLDIVFAASMPAFMNELEVQQCALHPYIAREHQTSYGSL